MKRPVVALCAALILASLPAGTVTAAPGVKQVQVLARVTCVIGTAAELGVIPPYDPDYSGGDSTYEFQVWASCLSTPSLDLEQVVIQYDTNGWTGYGSRRFEATYWGTAGVDPWLGGVKNRRLSSSAAGADIVGASCMAVEAGTHRLIPCFGLYYPEPGSVAWCNQLEAAHRERSPLCISDPVNPLNGAYSTSATDLAYPSSGIPLTIRRNYDSADATSSVFGPGWAGDFATHLYAADDIATGQPPGLGLTRRPNTGAYQVLITPQIPDPLPMPDDPELLAYARTPAPEEELSPAQTIPAGASIVLRAEGGGRYLFERQSDGTYAPPLGSGDTLEATPEGFKLTRADHAVYRFDDRGHLLSLVDANGRGLTYSWSGGKIDSITDVAGHSVTFGYAGSRVTSATGSDGRVVTYGYSSGGRLNSVTDARGMVTRFVYQGGLLDRIIRDGDPSTTADDATVVDNTYDDGGRVIGQADALGNGGRFSFANGEFTYTDAEGHTTRYLLAGSTVAGIVDPTGATTSYGYDGNGDLVSLTDPRGNTWRNSYDDHRVTRVTGPEGITESFDYTAAGDLRAATDANGRVTTYDYSAPGVLVGIDPPGAASITLTRQAQTGLVDAITDMRGNTTTLSYDAAGQLVAMTSPMGRTTSYSHDEAGRVAAVTDPRGNEPDADPEAYTMHLAYDDSGHLTTVTDPLGQTTARTYDAAGRLSSETDANNHVTSYGYDAAGRLRRITAPDAGTTRFAYDNVGNLTKRTDANGHATTFAYDAANRVISMTDPLSNSWSYEYLAGGPLRRITDANGERTTYAYDDADRMVAVDYSAVDTPDVALTYDAAGQLTAMTDGLGTEARSYDAAGHLIQVARGSAVFAYDYDAASNLTSRRYPDGTETNYAYDADGLMREASVAQDVTTYGYDAAGNLARSETPNGVVQTYGYDAVGRMTETSALGPAGPIAEASWTFDAVGNPTSQVLALAGGDPVSTAYRYDDADRLVAECAAACPNPADSMTYAYDAVGNRLVETSPEGETTYVYDAADQLLELTGPEGPETFAYDAVGNQTEDNRWRMTYDTAGNRLTQLEFGLPRNHYQARYTYNGWGNRVTTVETYSTTSGSGSRSTTAAWDTNFALPMLASERVDNAAATDYIYGMGRIGEVIPDQGAHYYTADRLGSVLALSDGSGAVETTYDYSAFGETTKTDLAPTAPANPFAFTGEYFTEPLRGGPALPGLYNLRARQYDPSTGRFLSRDPLYSPGSAYVYAGNRPTVMVDPSGMWFWGDVLWEMTHNYTDSTLEGLDVLGTTPEEYYYRIAAAETVAACGLASAGLAAGGCAGAVTMQTGAQTGVLVFNYGGIDTPEFWANAACGASLNYGGALLPGRLVRLAGGGKALEYGVSNFFGLTVSQNSTEIDNWWNSPGCDLEFEETAK